MMTSVPILLLVALLLLSTSSFLFGVTNKKSLFSQPSSRHPPSFSLRAADSVIGLNDIKPAQEVLQFFVPSDPNTPPSSLRQPFIDVQTANIVTISDKNYYVGTPVDYPIILCKISSSDGEDEEGDIVVPIDIDNDADGEYPVLDEKLFDALQTVLKDEFSTESTSDVGALWTPTCLTVVGVDLDEAMGDYEEEEAAAATADGEKKVVDGIEVYGAEGEGEGENVVDDSVIDMGEGEGDLQIILSFTHEEEEYVVCRSLEPTLIVARDSSTPGRLELFSAMDDEADLEIMEKIEDFVLEQLDADIKTAMEEEGIEEPVQP